MAYRVKDRVSYNFFNSKPAGSFDISYQAFQTVSFIRNYNCCNACSCNHRTCSFHVRAVKAQNKVCSCFYSFLYQFRVKRIDTYRGACEGFCKGYCFPEPVPEGC